jgi:predicted nuclease of predicted toxin-antitoxin system
MPQFIIDANLPEQISLWCNEDFVHVNTIDRKWKDGQIWHYALERNLTIISKDSDFGNRIMLVSPPPKVIHFKTGNMLIAQLHHFLEHNWEDIAKLSADHKLVKVFSTYIEAVQ